MVLDFKKGVVEVPPHKLKAFEKELGKLVTHQHLTCRKMASSLGQVRRYQVALPFLRPVTNPLREFSNFHRTNSWNSGDHISAEFWFQL